MGKFALFSLLFLAVSHLTWARSSKPIKTHDEFCQRVLEASPSADVNAIASVVVSGNLDIDNMRQNLLRYSGVTHLSSSHPEQILERGSKASRDLVRSSIQQEMADLGYDVVLENFKKGANVVATLRGRGKSKDVLEIVTHFDSVGNPGADDNGSGFCFALSLARLMVKFPPQKTIRFVFTDLEEKGFLGAAHHVEQLMKSKQADHVKAIIIDTIGWGPEDRQHLLVMEVGDETLSSDHESYQKREAFARHLNYAFARHVGVAHEVDMSIELSSALPRTAEHGPYWKAGIPAVLIGEPFEDGLLNPEYHKKTDNFANINWGYYIHSAINIAKMVANTVESQVTHSVPTEVLNELALTERKEVQKRAGLPPRLERRPYLRFGYTPSDGVVGKGERLLDIWYLKSALDESTELVATRDEDGRASISHPKMGSVDITELEDDEILEIADEVADNGGTLRGLGSSPDAQSTLADLPGEFISPDNFRSRIEEKPIEFENIVERLLQTNFESIFLVNPNTGEPRQGWLVTRKLDRLKVTPATLTSEQVARLGEMNRRPDDIPALGTLIHFLNEKELADTIAHLWTKGGRQSLDRYRIIFR